MDRDIRACLIVAVLALSAPMTRILAAKPSVKIENEATAGKTVWATYVNRVLGKSGRTAEEKLNSVQFRFDQPAHPVTLKEIRPSEVKGIRLLGHNNVPLKLLMACLPTTLDEVQEILKVVKEVDNKDKPGDGEWLKLRLVCDQPSTINKLRISQKDLDRYVEVERAFTISDGDIWMQDWGEIAAVTLAGIKKEELVVIDTNRGRGDLTKLPASLARTWSGYYLKKAGTSVQCGDYGGNIEVTPDDVLMIGSTSGAALRKLFRDGGYGDRTALLNTDWLQVGHVDEFLTTIPNPNVPRGYSIVQADPMLGLKVLRDIKPDQMITESLGFVASVYRNAKVHPEGVFNRNDENRFAGLFATVIALNKKLRQESVKLDAIVPQSALSLVPDIDQLIADNKAAAKLISANVKSLVATIKTASGDMETPVDVVKIPALFSTFDSQHRTEALLPGTANMVVLRRHLAVPDPLLPAFRELTDSALRQLGVQTSFITDGTYHFGIGQLHCGTNVFRHPNRYVFKPSREASSRAAANTMSTP